MEQTGNTGKQEKKKMIVPKGKHAFECSGNTFSKSPVKLVIGTTFVVDDKYEFVKQIGHGAYGVVCSAINKKTNHKVAIKKVPNAFDDLIDAKRIVREIRLLSKINKIFSLLSLKGFFDHENIISIVDVIKPEAKTGFNDIYIVTDLMETDLHRVIYSRQVKTPLYVCF